MISISQCFVLANFPAILVNLHKCFSYETVWSPVAFPMQNLIITFGFFSPQESIDDFLHSGKSLFPPLIVKVLPITYQNSRLIPASFAQSWLYLGSDNYSHGTNSVDLVIYRKGLWYTAESWYYHNQWENNRFITSITLMRKLLLK